MLNNHNTYEKTEFCLWHIICGPISFIWYSLLFRCIGNLSPVESRVILCGIIILISTYGCVLELKEARNRFYVFINLIFAYGVYTVITYFSYKRELIRISMIIAAVISSLCIIFIMCKKDDNGSITLIKKLYMSMLSTHTIVGLGMAAIVLIIGINVIWGDNVLHSKTSILAQSNTDEHLSNKNIETIALLEESRWKELTPQEKIDVLQVIANTEQKSLGLSHGLYIASPDLKEGTLGHYDDRTHQITIDLDHLCCDSPESILNTILHEAYHAYEYRCLDAYASVDEESKALKLFKQVKKYGEEFAEYVDGEADSYEYYMQNCETDARNYAAAASEEYYDMINEYYEADVIGLFDDYYATALYGEDGCAYLYNREGKIIAGPYLYIESDIKCSGDRPCRYTGMNGLIGYLDIYGNEITEPIYVEASEMREGKALVSERSGSVYYINSEGNRITKDYKDGFPFENQGAYARVLRDDGWAIINSCDSVVFSGADYINELPVVTTIGSAVKNGNAVIFDLRYGSEGEFKTIKVFDQFKDISIVHDGSFAIVKSNENLIGVVDYKGDIIIDNKYKSIDYEVVDDQYNSWPDEHIRFRLQKTDGTYTITDVVT